MPIAERSEQAFAACYSPVLSGRALTVFALLKQCSPRCYSAVKTANRDLIVFDIFSIAASTMGLAVLWHYQLPVQVSGM